MVFLQELLLSGKQSSSPSTTCIPSERAEKVSYDDLLLCWFLIKQKHWGPPSTPPPLFLHDEQLLHHLHDTMAKTIVHIGEINHHRVIKLKSVSVAIHSFIK